MAIFSFFYYEIEPISSYQLIIKENQFFNNKIKKLLYPKSYLFSLKHIIPPTNIKDRHIRTIRIVNTF